MRSNNRFKVFCLVIASFTLLGFAWDDIIVDLKVDPPDVVCEGDWVKDCNRVTGGVEIVFESAPDLLFFFEGLNSDVELGYVVQDAETGVPLDSGEGLLVPLSSWGQKVSVTFSALSGDLDWANVSQIVAQTHSLATSKTRQARSSSSRSGSNGGFVYASPSYGILTLSAPEVEEGKTNEFFSVGGVVVESGQTASGQVSSLGAALVSGSYPGYTHAFSVTVSGLIRVAKGGERFRAGADDTATLSVGGAASAIGGMHAFQWGNYADAPEGFQQATAAFSNLGGPYLFDIEGLRDLSFYEPIDIPYANLTASPASFVVPWDANAELTGDVTFGPKDDRVDYVDPYSEDAFVSVNATSFSISPSAFWASGAQPTNAVIKAIQSCQDAVMTNEVSISLSPAPTSLSLDPGHVIVTNAETIPAQGKGAHEPILSYEFLPEAGSSVVAVNGLTVTAGSEVLAVKEYCKNHQLSTNMTWTATLPWQAKYNSTVVASNQVSVTVQAIFDYKVKDECDCNCAEGTEAKEGCISFSQAFGRTPLISGLPIGRLSILEKRLSEALFTPAVLRYDHPMERRLDTFARVVTTPLGDTVLYDRQGKPTAITVTEDSRLEALANGGYRESFADRSAVEYNAEGFVVNLISTTGVRIPVENLGMTLERDNNGHLTKLTSTADGTMEVFVDSATSYRVVWTDIDGNEVKTFYFSKEEDGSFLLLDKIYPTKWTWDDDLHDFRMTRGSGDEATQTEQFVNYEGALVTVSNTVSRAGVIVSTAVQTIDSKNGNAIVGSTSGGRTTLSATRVTEGNGIGRRATATNALGATTSYEYDTAGRVTKRTTVGATTREITYAYVDDSKDLRPTNTCERVNGVLVREQSFLETFTEDNERVETVTNGGLTTITTYYPVASENLFEAGKISSVLRPNGRMTAYDYDWDTLTETVTEGLASEEGFTLVSGQSTRQKKQYDVRGNVVRLENEAYINDTWYPLSWETRTYSAAHKHIGSVFSNGKSSDSRWNCTGPLWEIGTDGIATTNAYNSLKQMVSSTRYGSFGALTTTYEYDADGRVTRTQRGDLVSTTTYDLSGRVLTRTDEQGRTTTYSYPDEMTTIETLPNGGTRLTTLNADGRTASVTGTAVTPEYYTYGPNWTLVHYGTPTSARWQKTFTDTLGRTVREERSGANGATLVTTYTYNNLGQLTRVDATGQAPVVYTYNAWGDQIATQVGERIPQETTTAYVLVAGMPWQETVQTQGPLIQRSRVNPDGTEQVITDVRGNEHTTTIEEEGAYRTTIQYRAGIANPTKTVTLDGASILSVDTACVTNSATYDVYQRLTAQTDGRGNTTTRAYDTFGRLATQTDAAGAVTAYGYDAAGQVIAITNALGNVITYDYDVRGNKTYEGGATYPVTYAYDTFGQKVGMTTYRDEAATTGDTTTWVYDEATGALIEKEYADGHGVTYTLTDLGQVATRTDARGKVTTLSYNLYGDVIAQDYSDDTPDIMYQYDNMGRQTQATDAVGTTTFTYNAYGDLTTESVSGLYSKTLIHYFDSYGRDLGYTIDGTRTLVKEYDGATGRLSRAQMGGGWFAWDYLAGSNLKSKLTYPNGATASWTYEPTRDLLTSVTNRANGAVISAYDYTNDILGRRTVIGKSGTMMEEDEVQPYTYNIRNELTSGQGYSYDYDDIGNRIEAEGRDYTANELNQYTAIDSFTPTYDLDGNQTKILTSTGEWQVEYNAENRPIRWTQGNIEIEMVYDRMGRRILYHETRNGANYIYAKFVYNGYLCIQRLYGSSNGVYQSFVWDPTEPVATRPLCMQVPSWGATTFYMHDGNKNVSDLIYYALANGIAAHYDYAPFGAVTRTARDTRMTQHTFIAENPFRFSSEYHDNTLGLVYYNYRHYNPKDGRWCGRDLLATDELGFSPFAFCLNNPVFYADRRGLCEYEVISSHSVSALSFLNGSLFDARDIIDRISKKTKFNLNWVSFDVNVGLEGQVKFEKRKCCTGPRSGEIIQDQIWNIAITGDATLAISTNSGSFDNYGIRASYWLGGRGAIGGSLAGVVEGESDYCSGRGVELDAKVAVTFKGQVALGGSLEMRINRLVSLSLSATGGIEIDGSYVWFGHRSENLNGWQTLKGEWSGSSARFFIQVDALSASYRYEYSFW